MEKERLHFCIGRYDHYFDSINNKVTVFLALATFVVGGLIAGYTTIVEKVDCGPWIHFFLIATIGIGFFIMLLLLVASIPYLTTEKDSVHYFGSVSSMGIEEFQQASKAINEEKELQDLRKQTYLLAVGLKRKFAWLKLAGILFVLQFILFIPLIICLILNFKK